MGSVSIIVAHHMYAMPPYPYIATDYPTQLSLFTHHMWIGGFCVCGAAAHAGIFMVRDYNPAQNYNNLLAIYLNEFNYEYLLKGGRKYRCKSILKVLNMCSIFD